MNIPEEYQFITSKEYDSTRNYLVLRYGVQDAVQVLYKNIKTNKRGNTTWKAIDIEKIPSYALIEIATLGTCYNWKSNFSSYM